LKKRKGRAASALSSEREKKAGQVFYKKNPTRRERSMNARPEEENVLEKRGKGGRGMS